MPVGRFVEEKRHDPAILLTLCATLCSVLARLIGAEIAHGDWQHDNLLVSEDGRRVVLVDYDGVYIPELAADPPGEQGHPNYQHPTRSARDYGPAMDRFACLVMQTGLVALAAEPTLWDSFCDGDALIFHRADLLDPAASGAFAAVRLVAEQLPELDLLVRRLEDACQTGVAEPVDATVIQAAATRLGASLGRPPVTTRPAVRAAAQASAPPALSAEVRGWIASMKVTLRRQQVRYRAHLSIAWVFLAGMLLSNMVTSEWVHDPFLWQLMSFF